MKKVFLVIGAIFILLLVAIISVPLFVDVDQYRPQITAEANKRINGELQLGKLKLSLWGAIKIHAESIVLKVNGFQEPLVDTKQFHLEIPFMSVISGNPQIIAVLDAPKIRVRKEANGKMNVMELMKKQASAADPAGSAGFSAGTERAEPGSVTDSGMSTSGSEAAVTDEVTNVSGAPKKDAKPDARNIELKVTRTGVPMDAKTPPASAPAQSPADPATGVAPAAPAQPAQVPKIVAGARLGVKIREGEVHYVDAGTSSQYEVNGLDLDARNLGLGSTMDISVKAPVKGSTPAMTFAGPVSLAAKITPVLVGNVVKSVKGNISADASELNVEMKNGMFRKTPKMPLTVKADIDGDERETLIKSLEVRFHNYQIHAKGRATAEPVTAKIDLSTEPLRLNDVQEFVPMVAAYQLKGVAGLNLKLDYSAAAIRANGDLSVKDGSFFMKEYLKAPMDFQLQAGFSESNFSLVRATLTAPDSDLQLTGDVKNFTAPQFAFALSGKSFNVDKAIVLPSAAPAKTAFLTLIQEAIAADDKATSQQNPMLKMAANPVVANASGVINAKLGRLTAYNANFEDVLVKSRLQNMMLYVPEASLRTFGGAVKANFEADLKSPALTYKTAGSVANVSAKDAFATYFPKYKDTLEATTDASWNLSGASFPPVVRMRSIKGTAKLLAKDGALKSIDVQDTINKTTEKVPFLKGKKVQLDDGFKTLTADLRFDNGNIILDPLDIQPRKKGFVIKGKSTIAESLEQDSYLDIYDPQGILPKEFEAGGKAALALHITGPLNAPKPDYEYTVKKLAGTAGKNVAKEQGLKAIGKALGVDQDKSQKDQLKEAADKLKKKFFKF